MRNPDACWVLLGYIGAIYTEGSMVRGYIHRDIRCNKLALSRTPQGG